MSPARALGLVLAIGGAVLVLVNRSFPDESLWLGALTFGAGTFLAIAKETRRRRGALEVLAAAWLVLIGAEVATRRENALAQRGFEGTLIHWVDDPALRYDLLPSVPCEGTVTNDRGMVDVPRTVEKPSGTMRVACLGDSVGADCSLPHQTTCAALESMLHDRRGGRPVEGLNFSVFGYNTMQEARTLELKAAAFRPDAIVVLYVVNDPYPDLAVSHFLPGHLKFEGLLFGGARKALTAFFPGRFDPLPIITGLYEERRAWDDVVVAGFDRIAATAKQLGVPVVVAVFPLFLDPPWTPYADIYSRVAREAAAHGFVGLDLSRVAYRDVPVSALLKPSKDPIHPNARAHWLAARAIADALLPAEAGAPP